ncbi:MAG: hypothetical protein KatS3mg008_0981 [Acidimicrobiales bacterium]|nr:MAG: hypothetical protein KatS3mg008_0981 [Acidimicrobiales bacterium]
MAHVTWKSPRLCDESWIGSLTNSGLCEWFPSKADMSVTDMRGASPPAAEAAVPIVTEVATRVTDARTLADLHRTEDLMPVPATFLPVSTRASLPFSPFPWATVTHSCQESMMSVYGMNDNI